jgi:hypothetical protein
VIAGKLSPRVLGLVTEWAALHREELLEEWELAVGGMGACSPACSIESHRTIGVSKMLIDVIDVKPLDGHKLDLTFEDGLRAIVDLDKVIERFDGVFAPLRDPEYFRQVRVDPEIGTIVWRSGADLCPSVLYSHASGKPIDAAVSTDVDASIP